VIRQLGSSVQVDDDTWARGTVEGKQWFMQQFAGVTVFKEAVEKIAAELGV